MASPSQTFFIIVISFFLTIPFNASLSPSPLPSAQTLEIPQKLPQIADNAPSFVKASLVSTMTKTEEFIKNVIDKKLAVSAKMDTYSKNCLETCKKVYENAIDSMKEATLGVNERDFFKANVDISAMYSFFETCHDCVVETNEEDPDFQNFQKWAQGIASDCLDKVSTQQ